MKRFFIKRRWRKEMDSQDVAIREQAIAAAATTPERLMAIITDQMGSICNDKEEFDELLILLMDKAPGWVKRTAELREYNVLVQKKQGKDPNPLIL